MSYLCGYFQYYLNGFVILSRVNKFKMESKKIRHIPREHIEEDAKEVTEKVRLPRKVSERIIVNLGLLWEVGTRE